MLWLFALTLFPPMISLKLLQLLLILLLLFKLMVLLITLNCGSSGSMLLLAINSVGFVRGWSGVTSPFVLGEVS